MTSAVTDTTITHMDVCQNPLASTEYASLPEPSPETAPRDLLKDISDTVVDFFSSNPFVSLEDLLAHIELNSKSKSVQIPRLSKPLSYSTIASRSASTQAGMSFSDADKDTQKSTWSQVGSKRPLSAQKTESSGTRRVDLPDLKVVHVRGFNVSPENPVTVLRDLIREEFQFDTSAIWNLSGRDYTQIVEMVVVKDHVPALLASFAGNKFDLVISTSYDP